MRLGRNTGQEGRAERASPRAQAARVEGVERDAAESRQGTLGQIGEGSHDGGTQAVQRPEQVLQITRWRGIPASSQPRGPDDGPRERRWGFVASVVLRD